MNRYVLLAVIVMLAMQRLSFARPPYPTMFAKEYENNAPLVKAAIAAKCNVCHDAAGKSKKDRNDYGKALNKHLTAQDFQNLKGVPANLRAKVKTALQSAENETNAAGKKFGAIIKGGNLPVP